jgi:nicotinate-nucleotide adenylyltransferase
MIHRATEQIHSARLSGPKDVVFGLSGNPPTLSHLRFIQHLLSQFDTVHVILNAQSPLKSASHYVSSEIRFQMLQHMLKAEGIDFNRCKLDRTEIDREAPSYMVVTLCTLILKSKTPQKMSLALGLDGLKSFTQWHRWRDIAPLSNLRFYPRPGIHLSMDELKSALQPLLNNAFHVVLVAQSNDQKIIYDHVCACFNNTQSLSCVEESLFTFEGSATEVRDYYRLIKKNNNQIHPHVHPIVDAIIRKQGLYGYLRGDLD